MKSSVIQTIGVRYHDDECYTQPTYFYTNTLKDSADFDIEINCASSKLRKHMMNAYLTFLREETENV